MKEKLSFDSPFYRSCRVISLCQLQNREDKTMNENRASTTTNPVQTLIEAMHLAAVLFGLIAAVIAL